MSRDEARKHRGKGMRPYVLQAAIHQLKSSRRQASREVNKLEPFILSN